MVSQLCPTQYMGHPLAVLAMQAKLGEEFERRYAMLATHISIDQLLQDFSMLQTELADFEAAILLRDYTSTEPLPLYAAAAIGGEYSGAESQADISPVSYSDIEEMCSLTRKTSLLEVYVRKNISERRSKLLASTSQDGTEGSSFFNYLQKTYADTAKVLKEKYDSFFQPTDLKLSISSSIQNYLQNTVL